MKELSWVLQLDPLIVLMKANLRVPCLDIDWDNNLVLHLNLLMVLCTEIKMACWMAEHSGSYLVHLMDLCLVLMKASYSDLLMVKFLAQHFGLQMESHLDFSLSDFLQPPRLPCFTFLFILSDVLALELVSASLSTFSLL